MKKLILGTIFFVSTMVSYAEVKDELNLFKDTEKVEIEKKIESLKNEYGTTIYVTTLPDGESFIPAAMEKVIVVNFNKEKDSADKVSIQLKFTPDLNVESKEDEIGEILDNSAHLIEAGKNSEYTLSLLEGIGGIFKEQTEERSEIEAAEEQPAEKIEEQTTEEPENQQEIEIVETIMEEPVPVKEVDYKKYIIAGMAAVILLSVIKIAANAKKIAKKNKRKQR